MSISSIVQNLTYTNKNQKCLPTFEQSEQYTEYTKIKSKQCI